MGIPVDSNRGTRLRTGQQLDGAANAAQASRQELAQSGATRNLSLALSAGLFIGAFAALVGFTSAVSPAAAADEALPDRCIRTQGCIGQIEERWNKREFDRLDSEQLPNKFTIPSTGAGRYRLYGLDYASPIPFISNSTDGTYKLSKDHAQEFKEDDALRERVKPLLGMSPATKTNSPFAPFSWGKTAWQLQGTKILENKSAAGEGGGN